MFKIFSLDSSEIITDNKDKRNARTAAGSRTIMCH